MFSLSSSCNLLGNQILTFPPFKDFRSISELSKHADSVWHELGQKWHESETCVSQMLQVLRSSIYKARCVFLAFLDGDVTCVSQTGQAQLNTTITCTFPYPSWLLPLCPQRKATWVTVQRLAQACAQNADKGPFLCISLPSKEGRIESVSLGTAWLQPFLAYSYERLPLVFTRWADCRHSAGWQCGQLVIQRDNSG